MTPEVPDLTRFFFRNNDVPVITVHALCLVSIHFGKKKKNYLIISGVVPPSKNKLARTPSAVKGDV